MDAFVSYLLGFLTFSLLYLSWITNLISLEAVKKCLNNDKLDTKMKANQRFAEILRKNLYEKMVLAMETNCKTDIFGHLHVNLYKIKISLFCPLLGMNES